VTAEQAQRAAKEAEEKAKQEAKEAKKKAAEAKPKEKAKREAKEAKERAKREAKEAKRAEKAGGEEAETAVMGDLYKGMVELAIMPPIDLVQLENLGKELSQVENLRLVLVGGSVDKGSRIVVSAEEPIPLLSILREIPIVEDVVRKGGEIQVTLKAG